MDHSRASSVSSANGRESGRVTCSRSGEQSGVGPRVWGETRYAVNGLSHPVHQGPCVTSRRYQQASLGVAGTA